MPNTPKGLPYPAPTEPVASGAANFQALASAVDALLVGGGTPSSTPPGSPVNGAIWVYPVDATSGTLWTFRYNAGSSSPYKWEYVGGTPKVFNYDQGGAAFNNAAFATGSSWYWWVNAAGSVFPVPRSGDYLVRCKVTCQNQAAPQNLNLTAAQVTAAPAIILGGAALFATVTVATGSYTTIVTGGLLPGSIAGTHSVGMAWGAATPGQASLGAVLVEILPVRVS